MPRQHREFKKGMDGACVRKKREDNIISLRQVVREERLFKHRATGVVTSAASLTSTSSVTSAASAVQDVKKMVAGVYDTDFSRQLESITLLRKLLSTESNPPIQEVINAGVVPQIVLMLSNSYPPEIQFEAAWTLTNIASGTSAQTRIVVENGAIPGFVRLLHSSSVKICEQAVWALGNIAGDSQICRDYVLREKALPFLVDIGTRSTSVGLLRNITWTISNLCRGVPHPKFEDVKCCLPKLVELLDSHDEEIRTDACWAISHISDDKSINNEKITAVIEASACPKLVKFLSSKSDKMRSPAIRCIGNLVTGDAKQTQHVLDCGLLEHLPSLLNGKKNIQKETCWAISNITAGTSSQIISICNAGLFEMLMRLLNDHVDWDVQKEAIHALSNAASSTEEGSSLVMNHLVKIGLVPTLCERLKCSDVSILMICLDALENLLRNASLISQNVCELVEEAGGLDGLEQLQHHENMDVCKKVQKLLNFFKHDDIDSANAPSAPIVATVASLATSSFLTFDKVPSFGGFTF